MGRDIEDRIAALARAQHGVVTRTQLLGLGLRKGAIRHRVRSGRFCVLHRGVYLAGPIMPPHGREMAAVLACGSSALLSHHSAASLWGLVAPAGASPSVDVTVPEGVFRQRSGVVVRRASRLDESDRTSLRGIPITTPARTLLDLASTSGGRDVERAVARAERERLVDAEELSIQMARYRRRPGIPALRAVLAVGGGPALTRSEAEARFLSLIRKARLPAPEANAVVSGYEIDFFWRAEGIAVEVDGYRYHSSRPTFEIDRRRATQLAARGVSVIRLSWRQIVDEGVATAVQLGQALLQAQHRPPRGEPDGRGDAAGAERPRRRR